MRTYADIPTNDYSACTQAFIKVAATFCSAYCPQEQYMRLYSNFIRRVDLGNRDVDRYSADAISALICEFLLEAWIFAHVSRSSAEAIIAIIFTVFVRNRIRCVNYCVCT